MNLKHNAANFAFADAQTLGQRNHLDYFYVPIIIISLLLHLFCFVGNSLLPEEAYYWNYAQHLDFSYLDHPGMVAFLIKSVTSTLGNHELAIRLPAFFCWLVTAAFSYRLAQLFNPAAGRYALLLVVTLPFFFLQSLVITPDLPLLATWSAALYYLYQALVLNKNNAWYCSGVFLGLGMLSKYSIALLGLAILLYMITVPQARRWFIRKEPYCCLAIVLVFFMPVVYWNATHDWASFVFQSTRRMKFTYHCSLPVLLGLLAFFLTPLGVISLWKLLFSSPKRGVVIAQNSARFLQLFTFAPISIFALFSLNHGVKFNWIGPALLAIIPWLALQIVQATQAQQKKLPSAWLLTLVVLLLGYSITLTTITLGWPNSFYQLAFKKYIDWEDLTLQLNLIATEVAQKTGKTPVFAPLDTYYLASELSFYQTKSYTTGLIPTAYPVMGRHIFGEESLMYRFWANNKPQANSVLILISPSSAYFNNAQITNHSDELMPIRTIWSHSQQKGTAVDPYFLKVVHYHA